VKSLASFCEVISVCVKANFIKELPTYIPGQETLMIWQNDPWHLWLLPSPDILTDFLKTAFGLF
jgi:hypothetical protein